MFNPDEEYSTFRMYGVAELYDSDVLKKLGYKKDLCKNFDKCVLVYSRKLDFDNMKFGLTKQKTLMYIHPEMIKELYSLHEGKEKFPELFL